MWLLVQVFKKIESNNLYYSEGLANRSLKDDKLSVLPLWSMIN